MKYPGRIIKKGETDKNIVNAVQNQLNKKGCGPVVVDGDFGNKTFSAVKLFQTRFTDSAGNPLKIDGEIGSLTWSALFGESVTATIPESELYKTVLDIARSQIGKVENPLGSNSGPDINKYHQSVGIPTGLAWCMAFVYWCYNEAYKKTGKANPLIKTGGVLNHWNKATCKKITSADAIQNPALVKPGHIFIISTGSGTGHTGLVESVNGGILTTIEGNTNEGGSREGIGVFRRSARTISSINKGFLVY